MFDLSTYIENEKKRYINFVEENRNKKILIYGAGKQAKVLSDFLATINIKIDGYCVTNRNKNIPLDDTELFQVDEIPYDKNEVAFLIGVRNQLNCEIVEILEKNGFSLYLESSEYIRFLGGYGYYFFTNPMMEITTQIGCAVNCKFCPQSVLKSKYSNKNPDFKRLSFENFKLCIDRLPKNTLIEFAGFTEPFLNKDCMKMVKYATSKGYKVNMFTTLVGVDEAIFAQLLNVQFEEFVLHLPDVEGFSNIQVDDNYKRMLKSLIDAKKPSGESFVDYACAQGKISNELETLIQNKIRLYVVLNDRAGNLNDKRLYCQKNIQGTIRCELSQDINHNVLLPNGDVVLCSNDWGLKHVLGNLLEQSYEEVIGSGEAQKIRADMQSMKGQYSLCRNCFQAIKY